MHRYEVDRAIVETLGRLLTDDSQRSAKQLQAAIGSFFFLAAGGGSCTEPEHKPKGYCYPYRSSLDSLRQMCQAIKDQIVHDRRDERGDGQLELIRKIRELSETYMANFRQQRDAGTYGGNTGYICDLTPVNDWGRQMIALDEVFSPRKR